MSAAIRLKPSGLWTESLMKSPSAWAFLSVQRQRVCLRKTHDYHQKPGNALTCDLSHSRRNHGARSHRHPYASDGSVGARGRHFDSYRQIAPLADQLQDANCARDQQHDDTERDKDLNHRENLRPARQQRRVGRAKCRTLREGDEQIIDEPRPPAHTCKLATLVMRDLHLREEKAGASEFF